MDATIPINPDFPKYLRNLCKIMVRKFSLRKVLSGELANIEDFEVIEICSNIIGNPIAIYCMGNSSCIDLNSFSVIQCYSCRKVITHSGYYIKNLCFSYAINCNVTDSKMILCDCQVTLGTNLKYFKFDYEKIIIDRFPNEVLQNKLNFSNILSASHFSLEEIAKNNKEMMSVYDQRIEGCKKSIRTINSYIMKIYKQLNPTEINDTTDSKI